MNNEENLKELIKQNGHLIFERDRVILVNEELRKQIEMLQEIVKKLLNENSDIYE